MVRNGRGGEKAGKGKARTRRRQAWYSSYIEVTGQLAWATDAEGQVVEDIPAWRKFTGQSKEEVAGSGWSKAVHPDDVERVLSHWAAALRTGNRYEIEYRVRRHDGVYRHMLACGVPVRNGQGAIEEWVGACFDITERKQIEDTLSFLAHSGWVARGENVFQALARHLASSLGMDYVCFDTLEEENLSARTLAIWFDGAAEDNVTYALADTPCGQVVRDHVCCFPENVSRLFPKDALLQQMKAEGYVGTVLWDSQGKPAGILAAVSRRPVANPAHAVTILRIVGARAARELELKRAEEALRNSEEAARRRAEEVEKLMELAPVGIWLARDSECRSVIGNKAAARMYETESGRNISAGTTSGEVLNTERRFFSGGRELAVRDLPMPTNCGATIPVRPSFRSPTPPMSWRRRWSLCWRANAGERPGDSLRRPPAWMACASARHRAPRPRRHVEESHRFAADSRLWKPGPAVPWRGQPQRLMASLIIVIP